MSEAVKAKVKKRVEEVIPLGTRNPEDRRSRRVKCPTCGEDRGAQLNKEAEVKAAGWHKLCSSCAPRAHRKKVDELLRCGSTRHWGERDPERPNEFPTTCGICGVKHLTTKLNPERPGLRGLCEQCRAWARIALSAEHRARPSRERDAIYAKIRRLGQILDGLGKNDLEGPGMPFGLLAKRWDEAHPQTNDSTRRSQSYYVRVLSLHFVDLPIGEMNAEKVLAFRKDMERAKGRRGQRVSELINQLVRTLRRMYAYAVARGWLKDDPLSNIFAEVSRDTLIPPRDHHLKSDRLMTKDEEEKLLAVCVGKLAPLREAIMFLADTGMYERDRQRLLWANLDFENRMVRGGRCRVEMTPRLVEAMRRLQGHTDHNLQSLVFSRRLLVHDFPAACAAAGIDELLPSDLRRTAAWRMRQAGRSVEQIAAALGLADLNKVPPLLEVDIATAEQEINSSRFQQFIKAQFGTSSNGNGSEQKNGGAEKRKGRPAGTTTVNAKQSLADIFKTVLQAKKNGKQRASVNANYVASELHIGSKETGGNTMMTRLRDHGFKMKWPELRDYIWEGGEFKPIANSLPG